jgi:hypothetical protein
MVSFAADTPTVQIFIIANGSPMQRVLTISFSACWSVVFGVTAAGIAAAPFVTEDVGLVAHWGLPIVHAIAALLFLWAAASACLKQASDSGESLEIARSATTCGVVALILVMLSGASGHAQQPILLACVQLAGLGATYLVIRQEEAEPMRPADEPDGSHSAHRLALVAAHDSMLTRLSGRDRHCNGTDA